MGCTIELRSQEWNGTTFFSELIYEKRNAKHAAELICGSISEPHDSNVYASLSVMSMECIIANINKELDKTTPPIDKNEAEEYRELKKAILAFKKKHEEDWYGLEFLYIYHY